MRKRIYIAGGEPAVLSYDSKELSFNGETLTFWLKGITHFDVNAFVFSENEMADASITLDLILPSDVTPEFDRFWYVDFRGERFYLSTLKPTCVKNTESLQYTYTLVFKSQRADLERYEFANFVSASSVPQVVSYDFSLPLTVAQFVERMNINLNYYFGSGVWQMILDPEYEDNLNPVIYDGISTVTVSFSRQSLWSVLTGLYDVFGLRWSIASELGIMTIRLGKTPVLLDHTFEYGKDNGLTAIERINQQAPVYTRLSGRGSDRNLPYRYFKPAGSGYLEDPDNNTFTENIPYSNLMTASYRLYVKGWNDKKAGLSKQDDKYAYELGYNDAAAGDVFNPVDYVISESAELLYGIRKGSVADTDIYPTLQQVTNGLNEIVAVEEILSDNYEQTDASLNQIVSDSVSQSIYQGDRELPAQWTLQTAEFETIADFNRVSFYVLLDVSSNVDSSFSYSHQCSVEILLDGAMVDSFAFDVSSASGYNTAQKVEFDNLDASVYTIRASSSFTQSSGSGVYCTQTITNVTRHPQDVYKDTFDIWIKNLWNTTFQDLAHPDETPEQYMHRVWDGLIVPSQDITVMFSDGALAGEDYQFKIARPADTTDYFIYYDPSVGDSHWRLSLLKSDANMESSKLPLPNTFQNAEAGDKFFLINIEMPYEPYVYDAEQRLEDFLANELLKVSNENPTYGITPSSVFLESYAGNASIATGAQINLADEKILGVGVYPLTISNVTIEYTADAMLPKWSITVADKPTTTKNTIQIIQGDIKVLSSSLLSAQDITERVQLALDGRYLQKNGTEQTSLSKTTFKDNLTIGGRIQSEEYLQGQLGGYGFSIVKDALGSYVLEIDKINVRKSLSINELIINQVSIYGGIHVYSAAAMTVSSVDSSNADYHVCYLDIKNGTVLNQFTTGDYAYCQRFNPESQDLVKYYWKEVVDVGSDFIAISKTGGDGSINQIPAAGDNIAQLGHVSNPARQSALIIDQTAGGTVTQYAAIDNFSLVGKDYIRYGVDPSTGRAYEYIYGDMYVGGRNPAVDNYFEFDSSAGRLKFRGTITQDSVIDDGSGGVVPPTIDRGVYSPYVQYFAGNTVYYSGSTYYCFITPPIGTTPTNTTFWRLHAAGGIDAKLINLVASGQIISEDTEGVRTPSTISVTGYAQNTAITIWEYAVNGGSFSETAPTGVLEIDDTVTIISASIEFTILTIRATDGTVSDTMTIGRVVENSDGYYVAMSNESHTIPCDKDGNVKTYVGTGNKVSVYKGAEKLTPVFSTPASWEGVYLFSRSLKEGNISQGGASVIDDEIILGDCYNMTETDNVVILNHHFNIENKLTITREQTFTKSLDGSTGDDSISIFCENQNLSVEPVINAFTKAVTLKLLSGGVAIPTASHTSFSKVLTGLAADADVVGVDSYIINLTGFAELTTGVGYVNVSIGYGGNVYGISISVTRLGTPVMINGKEWVSGTSYTGNYIQRSVVKYLTNWYAAKTSAGTFTSTTNPEDDTIRWELLQNFTNVATDSLFAANANIAGFIYKNEQMVSQSGTINGDASTNWAHPDFEPTLLIDGSTGEIIANSAKIRGDLEAASGNFKALEDGTFEVEFSNYIPTYDSSGNDSSVMQTLTINNTEGRVEVGTSSNDVAYMTSQGIFANRAGIQAVPASSGIEIKAAIVGLGAANLTADAYGGSSAVCGVYGSASNASSNPAPTYGGYFNKLRMNGMYINVRSIVNTTYLNSFDCFISCYNTASITVYLPPNPEVGLTLYIKKINSAQTTIHGFGNQLITNTAINTYVSTTAGQMMSLTWDGTYWCVAVY